MLIKNCLRCNKEFYTTLARVKDGRGKYCSKKCVNVRVTINCLICNKEMKLSASRIRNYCNQECYHKSRIGKISPIKGIKHSREAIKNMKLAQSKVNHYWLKHKSKEHLKKIGNVRSKKYAGSNHPNWQGGITPIQTAIRNSMEYEEWRTKVFERDLYTCQDCGEVGGYLHADHIKSFTEYPDLRLEVSNGRTLCVPCHYYRTWGKIMPKNSNWGHRNYLRKEIINVN